MKNFLKVLIVAFVLFCVGCSKQSVSINSKKSVICSTFPQYDWMRNIIGDSESIKLSLLVDSGVDVHSYNPSPKDIVNVSNCDVFVFVGGTSEGWVNDILKQVNNENLVTIKLFDFLKEQNKLVAVPESESMTGGCAVDSCSEEGHHHHHSESDHADGFAVHEFDEHIWLSIENAILCSNYFCKKLCELDSENADLYEKNTKDYVQKLMQLNERFKDVIENSKRKSLLFADRFPFVYFVNDYGLDCYAAFVGCSAETEASFETMAFLTKKVDELELPFLIVLENSSSKIAETIVKNSKTKNQEILILNSLQSCTQKQIQEGFSYLVAMENNLNVLEKALN